MERVSQERDMTPVVSAHKPPIVAASLQPRDQALRTRLLWVTWMNILLTVLFLGVSWALGAMQFDEAFTEWQRSASTLRRVIVPVHILLSLIFSEMLRGGRVKGTNLMIAALCYEAFAAVFLSMLVNSRSWSHELSALSFSPVAMWILMFTSVVPLAPRLAGVGALTAALLDPAGLWLLAALDPSIEAPSAVQQIWRFMPGVLCVIPAVMLARLVHGLEEQVDAARSLGPYHLHTLLGQGGMAEVWEGEHRLLARRVAIKLVRPEWLEESPRQAETVIRRFQREARATSALHSPNTIAVYDYGRASDGTFYYVMERLDGLDLHTLVAEHGPQPPRRVAAIIRQVCHSLHEAHLAGLVHRDIKPANVFICRYGTDLDFVKVLDFGLVKGDGPDPGESQSLTREGAYTGTPAFIAPEIARGNVAEADGRADLYGLGCVMYWLLTGELVFPLGPSMEMIASHAHDKPRAPSDRGVTVPAELEAIVMQLLAKDPADRPASAADVSDRIAAWQAHPEHAADGDAWDRAAREAWWQKIAPLES